MNTDRNNAHANYDASRPLYFFHVPKTGGTTLQHLLQAHYPPAQTCPAQDEPGLSAISDDELRRYKLFMGHFWSLQQRLRQPLTMITWLRDPVARAVSMYKHILRDANHRLHELSRREDGFTEMLGHPALKNSQVRHLARMQDDYRAQMSDEECLALAQQSLQQCLFIGFTEQYSASTRALFGLLEWRVAADIPELNTASEHSAGVEVSEGKRAQLEAANAQDRALYDHARSRYPLPDNS